jgi:hypothetical protein
MMFADLAMALALRGPGDRYSGRDGSSRRKGGVVLSGDFPRCDAENGDVPTGPLLSPEYSCAPAHRVIYVLQRGQPGGKHVMALLKRSRRCRLGLGQLSPVCTENLSSDVVVMKSAQDGA